MNLYSIIYPVGGLPCSGITWRTGVKASWSCNMNMLNNFIEENFNQKTLIIVSNREPYIHKKRGEAVRVETPAGGLTSAMDDILKATGGAWVALGAGNYDR